MRKPKAFDILEFEKDIQELARVTKRSLEQVNFQQAQLIGRDVMKFTPPYKDAKSLPKVKNAMDAGKKAIDREVGKVMRPISNLKFYNDPSSSVGQRLRQYVAEDKLKDASQLVNAMTPGGVLHYPDRQLHKSRLGKRGKVRKTGGIFYVVDEIMMAEYLQSMYKKIGQGVAGWIVMAKGLELKIPGIAKAKRKHRWPGTFQKFIGWRCIIKASNRVPYLQDSGRVDEIVGRATRIRQPKLKRQIKMTIAGNIKAQTRVVKVEEPTQPKIMDWVAAS